jgi:predicted nucleotidyltransferase
VATARSEELRALAQRVADALPPEAIEVVLTGSVSRGVADGVSDIEILVVTEEPVSLAEAFELARLAGLEERDSWGDPATPTRRVFGYVDGQPVETIWWSRELAEESFAAGGSAEAVANAVPLRTSGLLESWQARLADYPDELAAERIEQAASVAASRLPVCSRSCARTPRSPVWSGSSSRRARARDRLRVNRVHQPTAKRLAARVDALRSSPSGLPSGSTRRSPSSTRAALGWR